MINIGELKSSPVEVTLYPVKLEERRDRYTRECLWTFLLRFESLSPQIGQLPSLRRTAQSYEGREKVETVTRRPIDIQMVSWEKERPQLHQFLRRGIWLSVHSVLEGQLFKILTITYVLLRTSFRPLLGGSRNYKFIDTIIHLH